ncbi:hypothetical protein CL635_00010 [bacterium]|nr:hypothetical protein [bacterium]|tara:strand:- start:342 stop:677 length:336 start_codon:yes stop_codon:yes gene_type:complete
MSPAPQIKSQEEIQEWLFDDLMGQIEPDLVSTNREKTEEMLEALPEGELKKKLASYEEAFAEFTRRWPEYSQNVIADLNADAYQFQKMIKESDTEEMANIEQKLDSDIENA